MDITSSSKWKELTRKIKFIDGTTYQRTLELFYAEFGMKMLEDDALRRFITTYQNKKIGLYYTKVKEDFYQLGADDLANAKRRSRSKLENKLVDEIGTVEDIESYKEALELYYNVFGDDMFEIEKVQRFIDAFELDNINITPNTVYRDLRAIKSAFGSRDEISQSNFTSLHPDIKPVKTIAPPVQAQRTQVQNKNIISPVQTQRTQVQNISNNILDEYMLIETVRTMPLWLNSESVSISKNSSINSLCAGLVNNAMSDFVTKETFMQFENIIQQKRLRTSNKAEYNRKMENNIFYELFCYSYLINVFEAVPKIMSGSLNVNFKKYVSLAENECRERVQNLDQEKRKIYNIETIWIVECKVIEKVATFYDMYRQQNRFFNEHKEDEKFQRRIDYLYENADKVIQELGCEEYIGYKVIPYMCMNKVLVSRYKEIGFPIVSYSELVEIISKSRIDN